MIRDVAEVICGADRVRELIENFGVHLGDGLNQVIKADGVRHTDWLRSHASTIVRVLGLGAGVRVSKRERPGGIAAAVHRVLDQPAFARDAQAVAATLA